MPSPRPAAFQRGISLSLSAASDEVLALQPRYGQLLDEVVALGATDVELVVEWSQATTTAIEITPHPIKATDDELLTWVMDQAAARGLRVFLSPILDVAERGSERPFEALAPSDWERWWWSYERFIMHHARIAENHHAALLSVGSELAGTEQDDAHWRALIDNVRKRFRGELTYTAGWERFESVSFWDALDVAGIAGYQTLSQNSQVNDEALAQGLTPLARRLRSWSSAHKKRYLFTEAGYPAQGHAAARPWDRRESGAIDAQLQLRCYRAFFSAFNREPELAGVYFWSFSVSEADAAYTPRGRPAARLMEHWFRGSKTPAEPRSVVVH